MTGWLQYSLNFWPTTRAMTSAGAPGTNPATMRTGLSGYPDCAETRLVADRNTTAKVAPTMVLICSPLRLQLRSPGLLGASLWRQGRVQPRSPNAYCISLYALRKAREEGGSTTGRQGRGGHEGKASLRVAKDAKDAKIDHVRRWLARSFANCRRLCFQAKVAKTAPSSGLSDTWRREVADHYRHYGHSWRFLCVLVAG